MLLSRARWSELLFGLIALLVALGLPVTPLDGETAFRLVHWYAMVLVASWLFVALRHPSRRTWMTAVGLTVYFLASILLGVGLAHWRLATNDGATAVPPVVSSPLLIGMAVLAQIGVGIRCWQSRAIWSGRTRASTVTPVP